MIRHLVMMITFQLTLMPAKGGISEHYSPHVILGRRNLDYNKHCQFEFGEVVTVTEETEPSNTMEARAVECIYLRPRTDVPQGGHYVMNLSTGEVLTSPTQGVKRCPLADTHVKAVEKMAQRQGITAIRFEGRYGDLLRDETDDARSAGVDYEDYDYEVEEEEENCEENEEVETKTTEETINEDEEQAARDAATGDYSPNVVSNTETDDEEEFDEETEEQEPEEPEPDLPPPEPEPQPEPIKQTFRTRSGKIYGASNYVQHREKKVNFAGVTANNEEKKTMKQLEMSHNVTTNVSTNPEEDKSYDYIEAIVMTHFINQMNDRARGHGEEVCFGQQHPFGQGMKTFGDRGAEPSKKELKQLHDRICFKPISIKEMTKEERTKAVAALCPMIG